MRSDSKHSPHVDLNAALHQFHKFFSLKSLQSLLPFGLQTPKTQDGAVCKSVWAQRPLTNTIIIFWFLVLTFIRITYVGASLIQHSFIQPQKKYLVASRTGQDSQCLEEVVKRVAGAEFPSTVFGLVHSKITAYNKHHVLFISLMKLLCSCTHGSKTKRVMYSFGIRGSWWENTFCKPTSHIMIFLFGFWFREFPTTWNSITPLRSSSLAASSRAECAERKLVCMKEEHNHTVCISHPLMQQP